MIKFHCSHCGTKISAESSDAGASANCPSCNQDLVVPVASVDGRADLQQTVTPSATGNLPLVPVLDKKSVTRPGKKIVMVGGLALAAFSIIGVITMAKPTSQKSDEKVKADIPKTAKVINLTRIGGKLDDFVATYNEDGDREDGDRYEVYDKAEKVKQKGYKVLALSHNSKIIVRYDDENIITLIVYFKHDENIRKAIPLNKDEIDEALRTFSRHKGLGWFRLGRGDVGKTSMYGNGLFDEGMKFGNQLLVATYNEELPYIIIYPSSDGKKAIDELNETTIVDWQNKEYRRAE